MFAFVLQQEHKKLAAKASKKTKKNKIILDESSNSSDENMSVDHMTISTTDNKDKTRINPGLKILVQSLMKIDISQ
jgi:hypothetical protein